MTRAVPIGGLKNDYKERKRISGSYIRENLTSAFYAVKGAPVLALRMAVPGEELTTYTLNTHEETVNIAKENQILVANMDRNGNLLRNENGVLNLYIIDLDTFYQTYNAEPGQTKGVVYPKGQERAFMQVNEDIAFPVSWDPKFTLDAGGYMRIDDDVYGIAKEEFCETYSETRDATIDMMEKYGIDPQERYMETAEENELYDEEESYEDQDR